MTQATHILQNGGDADAVTRAAEFLTDLVEDEGEAMLYTFDDDSVLVICGERMACFDDILAAKGSLSN